MNRLLKISEFAYLSGIKRKNLIYYDEIGLLSPERVMDNGYRFYSYRQLETVSVLGALQEVGMSLCEIKQQLDARTPASLLELFTLQRENVQEKIRRLERIQAMIDARLRITRSALDVDPQTIELRECPEELLFAGEEIISQGTEVEVEKASADFYELCDRDKIIYGYPFGVIISRQNLLAKNFHIPSRFFFNIPTEEGSRPKLSKPAGLYLVGFERAPEDRPLKIYGRLQDFMEQHGLAVRGNAYEEYLLDEIAVKDRSDYLLQVSIQVGKI